MAVRDAVAAFIDSEEFRPPPLPELDDRFGWPDSFSDSDAEDGPSSPPAIEREYYRQVGVSTVTRVLFLLLRGDLWGKPIGLSQTVQNAVRTHEVLYKLLNKLDNRFMSGVSNTEAGFHTLIARIWIQLDENTKELAFVLRLIFLPLLHAAGEAYLNFLSSYSSDPNPEPKPTAKNKTHGKKLPPDLTFLSNVREAQKNPKAASLLVLIQKLYKVSAVSQSKQQLVHHRQLYYGKEGEADDSDSDSDVSVKLIDTQLVHKDVLPDSDDEVYPHVPTGSE
ncbi:hypothetical protein DFH07DRAFT_770708 [Mycena maculata]|uniref:Uncharacterized protein n=1 Tax=Mycena maculata TaxID=230809 RepID=A0AAD7JHH9_9AGAR|nr:hypothetical protein DFH07DRAFT_770708 [Mycena maculata]